MTNYGHFSRGQIIAAAESAVNEPLVCLDAPRLVASGRNDASPCEGKVEYRESLSGTGTRIPRCDKHWREALDRQDEINRRYPATAPADFDPYYAGESWDEDY